MRRPAPAYAILAVAGPMACSAPDTTRSSSAEWSVSPEPLLVIGEVDGSEEYLFQSIVRARLLPDDRIVVADAGVKTIRLYGASGDFQLEIGRAGEGPGEMLDIADMWLDPSGSAVVFDRDTHRITRFGMDGSVRDSRAVQPPPSELLPGGTIQVFLGVFGDGGVGLGWLGPPGRFTTGSTSPNSFVLDRFRPDGSFAARMGEETFFEWVMYAGGGGGPVPLTKVPRWAVHDDSLYFTDGLHPTIEVRDRDGAIGRTIAVPAEPIDVDEALTAVEAALDGQFPRTPENLRGAPRPDRIPAIAGLLVDDEGFVWARAYEVPDDALFVSPSIDKLGGTWWVFDPSGRHVATVDMPDGSRPLHITNDRIVGVQRDELDVERVVVHTLER